MAIYGAGRMALQLLSFITVPVLTRVFSPTDYGTIETITAMTSVVALFATLGLENASQRSYFDYPASRIDARRAVLSTAFWTQLAWSGLLGLAFASGGHLASRLLLGHQRYSVPLTLAFLALPLTVLANFALEVLRLWHKPVRYAVLSVSTGALSVGMTLLLVVGYRWGLNGVYAGPLMASVVGAAISLWVVRAALGFRFDGRELRVMLAFGLPLLPVAASAWVLQLADRFFLLGYAPRSELGLYSLGVKLSNLLLFVVTAFAVAWSPFFLELYGRDPEQERQVRAQTLTLVTLVLCFGAVCLSVFAREFFLTVTSPRFVDAYKVVGLLCASIVAIGVNTVLMTGITVARRTGYFARYTVVSAVINTGLNFLLIPSFGMVGAALATALTYAVLGVLYYLRAQQLDPAPFEGRRITISLCLAAGIVAVGTFIRLEPVWLSVLVKVPLVLAFPLLAWAFGGVDPRTRDYVLNVRRTWFRGREARAG